MLRQAEVPHHRKLLEPRFVCGEQSTVAFENDSSLVNDNRLVDSVSLHKAGEELHLFVWMSARIIWVWLYVAKLPALGRERRPLRRRKWQIFCSSLHFCYLKRKATI